MLHLITISHENEITKEITLVAQCVCMLPDVRERIQAYGFLRLKYYLSEK